MGVQYLDHSYLEYREIVIYNSVGYVVEKEKLLQNTDTSIQIQLRGASRVGCCLDASSPVPPSATQYFQGSLK